MPDVQQATEAAHKDVRLRESAENGVRGWLLFFCFTTVVTGPAFLIRASLRTHSTTWATLYLAFLCVDVLLGVLIWTRSPLTFVALWIRAIEGDARQIWYFWIGWRFHSSNHLQGALTEFNFVVNTAVLILWLIYFHRSRRVLYTFGRNL